MTLKEKIQKIGKNRDMLTIGQRIQFGGIKSMLRNIKEESVVGGESHVQPNGIRQAIGFLDKCLAVIN